MKAFSCACFLLLPALLLPRRRRRRLRSIPSSYSPLRTALASASAEVPYSDVQANPPAIDNGKMIVASRAWLVARRFARARIFEGFGSCKVGKRRRVRASLTSFFLSSVSPLSLFLDLLHLLLLPPCFLPSRPPAPVPTAAPHFRAQQRQRHKRERWTPPLTSSSLPPLHTRARRAAARPPTRGPRRGSLGPWRCSPSS